jgi:hypothetical protein
MWRKRENILASFSNAWIANACTELKEEKE